MKYFLRITPRATERVNPFPQLVGWVETSFVSCTYPCMLSSHALSASNTKIQVAKGMGPSSTLQVIMAILLFPSTGISCSLNNHLTINPTATDHRCHHSPAIARAVTPDMSPADCTTQPACVRSEPQRACSDGESGETRAQCKTDKSDFTLYPHHHHAERFDPKEESWLYGEGLQGVMLTQAAERLNRRFQEGGDSLDSRVSRVLPIESTLPYHLRAELGCFREGPLAIPGCSMSPSTKQPSRIASFQPRRMRNVITAF